MRLGYYGYKEVKHNYQDEKLVEDPNKVDSCDNIL